MDYPISETNESKTQGVNGLDSWWVNKIREGQLEGTTTKPRGSCATLSLWLEIEKKRKKKSNIKRNNTDKKNNSYAVEKVNVEFQVTGTF